MGKIDNLVMLIEILNSMYISEVSPICLQVLPPIVFPVILPSSETSDWLPLRDSESVDIVDTDATDISEWSEATLRKICNSSFESFDCK